MDIAVPFGLRRNPFSAAVDADQAFQSAPYVRAFDGVLEAIYGGKRLIVVNGLPGSGKSLLLRALETSLAPRRRVERVNHAGAALGALGAVEVLLVDEADGIDDATRDALVESARSGGPVVVLACTGSCLPGATIVPLSPLGDLESRAFVVDRLRRAGRPDLFDEEALDTIVTAGDGLPQKLRLLAAAALTHAAVAEASRVEGIHARQAVAGTMMGGSAAAQPAAPAPVQPERIVLRRDPPPVSVVAAPAAAAAAPAAPVPRRPVVEPVMAAAPLSTGAVRAEPPAPPPTYDEPVAGRAGWWASTPKLVRLGILVGLLLLSLPLLGYIINVLKDQPAEEATTTAAIEEEPAPEVDAAAGAAIETAEAAPPPPLPSEGDPVPEAGGPPEDLLAEESLATESVEAPAAIPAPVSGPVRTPAPRVAEAPAAPAPARVSAREAEPEPELAAEGASARPAASAARGEPRLFVHYRRGDGDSADAAAEVARGLERDGFEVVDRRAVPSAPQRASVRYFFAEDRAAALEVAGMLADELREQGLPGDSELKAMTGYSPAPRRGTIEVWLPDMG
jgi:hypothetical protein